MGIEGACRLEGAESPLGRAIYETRPDRVSIAWVVPGVDHVQGYLTVRSADPEAFLERVRSLEGAIAVHPLDEGLTRGVVCRVDWDRSVDGLLPALAGGPVELVRAVADPEPWAVRLGVGSPAALAAFESRCERAGLVVERSRVHAVDPAPDRRLTDAQFEALSLAHQLGYFDDPRQASLADLAEVLDITRQSCSGRLRRAQRNLLQALLERPDTTVSLQLVEEPELPTARESPSTLPASRVDPGGLPAARQDEAGPPAIRTDESGPSGPRTDHTEEPASREDEPFR